MGNTVEPTHKQQFCPSAAYATQYDIQWSPDRTNVFYDFHRYVKCQRQPHCLRTNEQQFTCYVQQCKHNIRIRKTDKGRWVVSYFKNHDRLNGQTHAHCHHRVYTPNTQHVDIIKKVAKQDVLLTGKSSRNAVESQMLQNPLLNQQESVATLKRKIGTISHNVLINYPPLPTCAESAAQSLRDNECWRKDFYSHCEHILKENLHQLQYNGKINLNVDVEELLNDKTLTQEEKLVQAQLQLGDVLLKLNKIREILKLSRMSLNGSNMESDFLISMRLNGSMIIFGSRCGFEIIKNCSCIGFDQLCRICPNLNNTKIWEQSWILHGLYETNDIEMMDENFPCFVTLMDDHTQESYTEILDVLMHYAKDKIDSSYVCLTEKPVRLMGDYNFSEGWNRKYLLDLGMRQNWWVFLWNLKRFFAVITVKYEAFVKKGFCRTRSVERRNRCKALQAIWTKFDNLDRSNHEVVWKYVECLYLCWENEYKTLNELLQTL